MADVDSDWSTNSTDAFTVSLVTHTDGGTKNLASFQPSFTYPIFGDEETIFGYKGLKLHLRFHASDMRSNFQVTYTSKFKARGEVEATDIKEKLEEFLPAAAFDKSKVFDANISGDNISTWSPPGVPERTIVNETGTYELWKGSLGRKDVQQYLKRIQILVLLLIEGGSYIDLNDPQWSLERWDIFMLYKKEHSPTGGGSPYTFVGYSTVYKYHMLLPKFPADPVPTGSGIVPSYTVKKTNDAFEDNPYRARISQFVILPCFHGEGHGSLLYNAIVSYFRDDALAIEITVEDPNERFDDLRDYNDLVYLRTIPEFQALQVNTSTVTKSKGPVPTNDIVSRATLERIRLSQKIAPRQFYRLVEMQLLSRIPTYIRQNLMYEAKQGTKEEIKLKEREYYLWNLFVKQRLYRHNKQTLMQLDRAERIDKLEEAVSSVEADYARLLRELDAKASKKSTSNIEASMSNKRPRDVAEEEDNGAHENGASKKAKVDDA